MNEERVSKSVATKKETAYSKTQLLASKRFERVDKDVLAAILTDDAKYTIAEAEKWLKAFQTKEVQ
ncbi:hypothetical protein P4H71_08985 [Paenibacillus kribbensis]|uniref:hypothetical protein n=1 Tax=Paenibacillus kribbensis TaxID=172713 RepID=UPI002DBC5773|nr:hypothetical protein [Paenibacillus kribbensis]MEC0234459.1 hypothetical protein [Paenibacillus kribbensis]